MSYIKPQDQIQDGVTDRSPTENAVYDALALKANTNLQNLSFSGSNGQVLTLVAGVPAWAALPASGVTSVTASAPLASSGGTTPNITISQASALSDGYLSSTDWSTFNGKQNALTIGNLTGDTNANISITGGTGSVIGTGTSIAQSAATALVNGYLKSSDWSTFNGKMSNPMTTAGDIIVGGASGSPGRLALGAVDKVLVSDGTTVSYQYAGLGGGNFGTNNVILGRSKPSGITTGTQHVIIGTGTTGDNINSGQNTILIGYNNPGTQNPGTGKEIRIGNSITGYWDNGIAIGHNIIQNKGTVVIGNDAAGSGNSIVIGASGFTITSDSILLGNSCYANLNNSLNIGSASMAISTVLLGRGGAYQTAATAVKVMTQQASGTSNTDLSAGTLTLAGSQSTGNKDGGDVIIATAPAGASGTSTNAHVERIRAKASAEVVVNDTGVDFDFRVEGDTDANLLFVDAGTDKVGIGTATPAEKLEVSGNIKATSGDVLIATAGKGLKIKTGTNATAGIETGISSASSVTINTTAVLTGSLVFVQPINTTDKHGFSVSSITNATSFTVDFSGNYTGDLAWFIINPA